MYQLQVSFRSDFEISITPLKVFEMKNRFDTPIIIHYLYDIEILHNSFIPYNPCSIYKDI